MTEPAMRAATSVSNDQTTKGWSVQLTNRFDHAMVYASQIHAAQRRKGSNTPYIAHLLGVAAITLEAGGDEDQAIAALLHDAVEDQGGQGLWIGVDVGPC